MRSFEGKLAVVTGGAGGIGRELVLQLLDEGCSVATCDLDESALREVAAEGERRASKGAVVTTHVCDVSDEQAVLRFRDEVLAQHETDHVNLVFNNAGIAGSDSFVAGDREPWERIFSVCWDGVYYCSRAFVPLLVASDDGYLVNTSSALGFWATSRGGSACTAYCTAKFAVKGFSEALVGDFRLHAPHVKVAVVMPGLVGTHIAANSENILDEDSLEDQRATLERLGLAFEGDSDSDIRRLTAIVDEVRAEFAPTTAGEAATIILDGLRAERWRILVGDDVRRLDEAVRADPVGVYEPEFGGLQVGWASPALFLRGLHRTGADPDLVAVYRVRHQGDGIAFKIAGGELEVLNEEPARPDVTVDVHPDTFGALLRSERTLHDALESGDVEVTGDRAAFERLLATMRRPRQPVAG